MSDHHDEHGFAHVMSPQILLSVFAALIVLTILTVALAGQSFIPKNVEIIVALTIASIKGALVVLFFMHMIHDKSLNILMFLFSLVFVALFLGFALMDSAQYQPSVNDYTRDIIQQETAQ